MCSSTWMACGTPCRVLVVQLGVDFLKWEKPKLWGIWRYSWSIMRNLEEPKSQFHHLPPAPKFTKLYYNKIQYETIRVLFSDTCELVTPLRRKQKGRSGTAESTSFFLKDDDDPKCHEFHQPIFFETRPFYTSWNPPLDIFSDLVITSKFGFLRRFFGTFVTTDHI